MSVIRLAFVSEKLMHYRIGLLEKLSSHVSLSVFHSDPINNGHSFAEYPVKFHKFLGFKILRYDKNLLKFNYIILPFEIRIINLPFLIFKLKKKLKIGFFGIGVTASYANRYDRYNPIVDFYRMTLLKYCDFALFYDLYPKIKFSGMGINASKMYIAYNTVINKCIPDFQSKNFQNYLFIGSLIEGKGIELLIDSFHNILDHIPFDNNLLIIGEGPLRTELERIVNENSLSNRVIFLGEITNMQDLEAVFNNSRVCISPKQAGLSVLTSFSFGTPFITSHNAITGGERFSIMPGVTGEFFDGTKEELSIKMIKFQDDEYCKSLSRNSFEFYNNYRNSDLWVSAFIEAFANTQGKNSN